MKNAGFAKIILALILSFLVSCSGSVKKNKILSSQSVNNLMSDNNGANDFDFLMGKDWKVTNKVLNGRLSNSTEWSEFEAIFSGYQKIAGGYGNVDQFKGERNGVTFEASSLRLFNKNTQEWSIYWMDNNATQLVYQVTGKFKDGVGEFFGEEPFNGKMAKLRFLWTDISDRSARWEQAYYDSLNNEWETNWIMEFEALDD